MKQGRLVNFIEIMCCTLFSVGIFILKKSNLLGHIPGHMEVSSYDSSSSDEVTDGDSDGITAD